MRKALTIVLLIASFAAYGQDPGIRKQFPNSTVETTNRQVYYGFSRLVSANYDSLASYLPGDRSFYAGHDWQATDTISACTLPGNPCGSLPGVSTLWECLNCWEDPGSPDLTPFVRKDLFSSTMMENVEDVPGLFWDYRPDVASPSGGFVRARLDTMWLDDRYGGGGDSTYTLPIATASVLGGIKVGAGLTINAGTGVLSTTGSTASSNNIFVSPAGDDATGARGNIERPFLTLAGAKGAYTAGDVIVVNPGTYAGQGNLQISGTAVTYDFRPGAKVTFSNYMLQSPNANVTIQGEGEFTATNLLSTNSSVNINLKFKSLVVGGLDFSDGNVTTVTGDNITITSYLSIVSQDTARWEVREIDYVPNTADIYIVNNNVVDFYNTKITTPNMLTFYSTSVLIPYTYVSFHNCVLNASFLGTRTGTGTTNNFYGELLLENTVVNTTTHGVFFYKIQPTSTFIFNNCTINSAAGYYSMYAPDGFSGSPNIRILSGGLKLNARVWFDPAREITNLVPHTYAVVDTVNTITPFASVLSGIVVTGEPVFMTDKSTAPGQVPISDAGGTAHWGTVSGGGGGSGGDADSLGSVPASGYVTLTGTQTLTNKTLTAPTINNGSLGSASVATTQAANTNSTLIATTAYADAAVAAGIVSVRETITQTAHGLSAYTIIRHNGTAWVAASSSSAANSRALGIIESVTTNTFVVVYAGKITLSTLTAGTEYFLSSTGTLTTTEPTASGTVIKSILSTTTTTSGIVQIQNPGQEN